MMTDPNEAIFAAIAFAARAHQPQIRKDSKTPYVSHVFRVCLVARHIFGIDDPQVLTTAVLHDTIEDTTTDYDDIAEEFGDDVATWVAMLSKEMRLPEAKREEAYRQVLASAPWQVIACKLADIYDNLGDSHSLKPKGVAKTVARTGTYLEAMRPRITPETQRAYEIVTARHAAIKSTLSEPDA